MKIFHKEENGKEVVFVQERDVFYFIRENRKIPSIILEEYYKDGVKPVDADLSEFIKLVSEEAVRFFKEKDYIRLQPENDYMLPIILKEATILGKAVGLYRKF